MTLVDSNVVLDVITVDPNWAEWSSAQLSVAALRGPTLINDIIFAEVAVRYPSREAIETALDRAGFGHAAMPREALYLAAQAFRRYRERGGVRTSILPDFFVGAHAAAADLTLLTRDPRPYRTYFPLIRLIEP